MYFLLAKHIFSVVGSLMFEKESIASPTVMRGLSRIRKAT
jgi:hypothetical protein